MKRRKQSSVQAMARDARYAAMKEVAREVGADRIVVGHTADDQAETILMWMLRGAGLSGLAGMPFVREGMIVRPLLSSTREQVIDFLEQEGLSYRQDSSNGTSRYHRNRIRKELMPVIKQLAPAALRALQRQAELLRADDAYLEQVVQERWSSLVVPDSNGGHRLDRRKFAALPVALQRRLIRRLFRIDEPEERAASAHVVETSRRFFLSGRPEGRLLLRQIVVRRDGGWLKISRNSLGMREPREAGVEPRAEMPLAIPSTVRWAGTGQHIHVQIMSRKQAEPRLLSRSTQQAVVDADRITAPLVLRTWRAGDRIAPCGMGGKRKKLQDLFTDLQLPKSERGKIPVLAAPEGILWVAGVRQDERFVVREGTVRCLVATMSGESVEEGAR
jgi:tRNA(Ile)-lysidine synthase